METATNDAIQGRNSSVWSRFKRGIRTPRQVSIKRGSLVAWMGRAGFLAKAVIWSIIGILTVKSMVQNTIENESPQGVFIFLGATPAGWGIAILIVVLAGVVLYSLWRYTEAIMGQGYSSEFSTPKNFFRYRLSPFISGTMYALYAVFIIDLLVTTRDTQPNAPVNETCFPSCWMETVAGKIGLFFFGLALFIAFITQMGQVIKATFMTEMRKSVTRRQMPIAYWFLQIFGRIGFLGRALIFVLVSIVFFEIIAGVQFVQDNRLHTIAQALGYWGKNAAGRAVLMIMGVCLVVYGIFDASCVVFRKYPTRILLINRFRT